jgi:(R,R)-butanediol dehydrogenase / meso-butanediol dehydrogenase / diacetyl reductase
MKRIVYTGPLNVTVDNADAPVNPTGSTLIKIAYAGICGSDMNIYQGVHPRAKAPLVMGHEFSGTIVEGHPVLPSGTPVSAYPLLTCGVCEPCLNGTPHVCSTLRLIGIDCDGGMAGYATVPSEKVVELPADISLKAGAYVEPLAVAVHAVHRSGFKAGDRTVIFGAGPIGMSVAIALRSFGASSVVLLEANSYRLGVAGKLGFQTVDISRENVADRLKVISGRPDADIVFDCAAHPSVQEEIMNLTRIRGTMVVVGSYKKPAEVDLLKIEFKELTVIGTRVYRQDDFRIATDLLRQNQEAVQGLISEFPPEAAPDVFKSLLSGAEIIKAVFNMGECT